MKLTKPQYAALTRALQNSITCIDDWLNTYASDHCGEARVQEAYDRIKEHGGTIAYIADVQKANRDALAGIAYKSKEVRSAKKKG